MNEIQFLMASKLNSMCVFICVRVCGFIADSSKIAHAIVILHISTVVITMKQFITVYQQGGRGFFICRS